GNGTVSFTDLRLDITGSNKQLTASASGLSNALSSVFTVAPSAATAMVVQTMPASATAGAVFSPAPVVQLQDQFGNLVTTDSSTIIAATRNLGSANLQGTLNVIASGGLATFSNLTYNHTDVINLTFH